MHVSIPEHRGSVVNLRRKLKKEENMKGKRSPGMHHNYYPINHVGHLTYGDL